MTPLEHIMGLMDPSYSEAVRRSFAQSILDKHAHELAEQIRAWARDGSAGAPEYGSAENVLEAADLIDPKVQRARSEGDNT